MLTPLGKALRVLRMERGLLLKDMADGLEVSSSFLSAVETGRKSVPDDFVEKVAAWARLTPAEEGELMRAYAQTVQEFKIRTPQNMSAEDREAAALLARTFGSLPSEDIAAIRELILRRKA
jgi:transcriptional regulator with XRE-family HTH domain